MEKEELIEYAIRTSNAIKEEFKQKLINYYYEQLTQLKKQKEIIDKAVEYIKENDKKYYQDWEQDDCSTDIYLDEDEVLKLLQILEDKEV